MQHIWLCRFVFFPFERLYEHVCVCCCLCLIVHLIFSYFIWFFLYFFFVLFSFDVLFFFSEVVSVCINISILNNLNDFFSSVVYSKLFGWSFDVLVTVIRNWSHEAVWHVVVLSFDNKQHHRWCLWIFQFSVEFSFFSISFMKTVDRHKYIS